MILKREVLLMICHGQFTYCAVWLWVTYKMLKGCEGKHHIPTGYADLRQLKSIRPQPARAPLMGHNKSAMAWEWQKRFIFLCLANSITCTSRQIETEKCFSSKETVLWLEIKGTMAFSQSKLISALPYEDRTDKVKLK